MKLIELDFSLSNISNTYETALADEIDSKKSKEKLIFGFKLIKHLTNYKMYNLKTLKIKYLLLSLLSIFLEWRVEDQPGY